MHTWKNLLEQDKKYESEDLHIDMEPQLDIYGFPNQIATLDIAVKEENDRLETLATERKEKLKAQQTTEDKNEHQKGGAKKQDKKEVKDSKKEDPGSARAPTKKKGKEKKIV